MNTKKEIILGIKSREKEIYDILKYYDAYLYLVVYDKLNQHGNEWHSIDDTTSSIDDLIMNIKTDQLVTDSVNNCAIDLKDNKATENISDTLFEVAETLANAADQCEDMTDNASNAENYGFIGIVNVETAKWDYFKTEPKHLRDVYELTEEGYDIFYSWHNGFGFKDYNDMEILQMLTENKALSKEIGHFVYN